MSDLYMHGLKLSITIAVEGIVGSMTTLNCSAKRTLAKRVKCQMEEEEIEESDEDAGDSLTY